MPKFSIIIPVYNVENYIKRTLDSVFKQTYKDFEVIIVDDGCTDNSITLAKEYDVKIINEDHVGVSQARNNGQKHAKGEYLLFLDSDDYWNKDLLANINKSLKNKPDVVRFQVRTVTDNKEKIEFEQVALINIDNENYAILHPVNLGYQDDEVIAYSIKIDNLNYELLEVEDDDLLDKIYNEYQKLYKSKK